MNSRKGIAKTSKERATPTDPTGNFLIMAGVYTGLSGSTKQFLEGHCGPAVPVDRADRSKPVAIGKSSNSDGAT